MASDLNRAYIIDGADLQYALSGREGRPPLVPNPRDVAAWLLECIGKPLDGRPGVTVSQLATALEGFYVDVWHHGESVHAEITNADETAEALHATLSRMAALRGDEPSRWPMTRGELATRLSKALERVKIAVRDPEPSGSFQGSPPGWKPLWAMGVAFYPADTAELLVDDIDAQGTEDEADRGGLPRVHPGNAVDEALQRCRAALSWLRPDNRERIVSALVGDLVKTGTPRILPPLCAHDGDLLTVPDEDPDPELAALSFTAGALDDLGDLIAARRIIRYLADRYDTEVIP